MTAISAAVDLRPMFGPVRDQGARPTCLAFAASDAHTFARGNFTPLSTEYVFRSAQMREGRGLDQGATLGGVLGALRDEGQPLESAAPYSPSKHDPAWIRPAAVQLFRRNSATSVALLDELISDLDSGIPSVALIYLSRSFYRAGGDGFIDHQASDPPDLNRGHAVVVAGYGETQGLRVVLIRNSWGSEWAAGGYAWLTEKFLSTRLYGAAKMMEDMSVPANSNSE